MTHRAAVLAAWLAVWCSPWASQSLADERSLANPRFSWDENYLTFDHCDPRCKIVLMPVEEGTAVMLNPDADEGWVNPAFDPLSDRIVFVISKKNRDGAVSSQIATSRRDGSHLTVLTNSLSVKRHPSFSFDGKRVIFWAKEPSPFSEGPRFILADAYAVVTATGEEKRLTDLRVLDMSAPFFLPDGQHITFSTAGAARPRTGDKRSIQLEKLYPNRTMFVVPIGAPHDLVPFVSETPTASLPMPVEDGSLAFLVRVNEYDGTKTGYVYDVFLAKNGSVKRHTTFSSYVRSYGISRSGRYVAFIGGDPRKLQLVIWDTRVGRGRPIALKNPVVIRVAKEISRK
jgi:Tol biopolymer transport system component